MKFTVSIAQDDIEVDILILHKWLKNHQIQSQFINDTFIKLESGDIIRINNKDLEKYKQEIRNIKIDSINEKS